MPISKTVETAVWALLLPEDWRQGERTAEGELYFESADGKRALYIATRDVDSDTKTPEDALQSFLAAEERANRQMPNCRWLLMEKTLKKERNVAILDFYDKDKQYRIVSKILIRLPVVVKSSFHDYECADYETSKKHLEPFIESLKLQRA